MKSKTNVLLSGVLLALLAAVSVFAWKDFSKQAIVEPIVPGPGVSEVRLLSDYFEGLKGTPGDSAVYVLDSKKSGGTIVVMGGTHPTEPATLVSAVVLIENAVMTEGKMIVIPHSNASGFTWTEPGQGHAPYFYIQTDGEVRYFRFGARGTSPVHQWPDPDMFLHYPSGQKLAADEIRNLNRCHPGKPDGLLTQKVAYAFRRLVEMENADILIDQHEAPPEKPLVDAMCVHQNGLDLAAFVAMDLEMQGIPMRVEASPEGLHGFSHRELGDFTKAIAVLTETSNPAQGSARGRTDETLAVTGKDAIYDRLLASGKLKIRYGEEGEPLNHRVGRNIATVCQFAASYSELNPDRPIVVTRLPSYEALMQNGIGKYLLPLPKN